MTLANLTTELRGDGLHADLRPWLCHTRFGWRLNHPLVQSFPCTDEDSERINNFYLILRGEAEQRLKTSDWEGYLMLHTRPYRVLAFQEIARQLNDANYWELLGETYIDTENYWQHKRLWRHLLTSHRPGRNHIMRKRDRAVLNGLTDQITIYRGYSYPKGAAGWSWTTDRKKAVWFANRGLGEKPRLAMGELSKTHVIACFNQRGESEVVADPKLVRIISTEHVNRDESCLLMS